MLKKPPLFHTAILLLIGGAISVLFGEVWTSIKPMITLQIPIHWLIFIIAYVIALVLIVIDRLELRKSSVRIGLHADLEPLSDYLSNTQAQLDLMGTSLGAVSRDNNNILEDLLNKGVRVRFLILNPNSKVIPELEKLIETAALKETITSSLRFLCIMRHRLHQDKSKHLEIKTYDFQQSTTILIRDANNKNGLIRFEPIRYGGSHEHTLYVISKNQKKFWQIYTSNFEKLWNQAEDYVCA